MAKHRRLGAVADHVQLRGVVRQTATVVSTAITACILVAGLITVVLAGMDSAKRPAPQVREGGIGGVADHDHGVRAGHIARAQPILALATVVP